MQLSSQVLLVLFSFMLSFIISGLLAQFPRFLPDVPNERSAHKSVVSRGGGIAIIVPFLTCIALIIAFSPLQLDAPVVTLIIGTTIIWIVGLVDDAISQPALPRLGIQLVLALLVVSAGLPALFSAGDVVILQGWPARVVQIFWILLCINFFNFMDGLDGLAGFQALILTAAAGILLLMDYETLLAVPPVKDLHPAIFFKMMSTVLFSLSAAILGFLVWNLAPARVFMGDNGSYLLGFVTGYISLLFPFADVFADSPSKFMFNWSAQPPAATGWITFLILFFPILLDAGLTLAKRLLGGHNIFQAHRNHFFQLLHRSGRSPMEVLFLLACINGVLLLPLWTSVIKVESRITLGLLVFFLVLASSLYFILGRAMERALRSKVLPFVPRKTRSLH